MHNSLAEKINSLQLDDNNFGGPVRKVLLRDAVLMYEANKRQGNACTKTKGEVAGGGRKPWVQKHTGRARAGSIRSPLWRGGGIAFGPKPRDYSYSIPKKARKQALFSALISKIRDNDLVVVDDFGVDYPKTKKMIEILKVFQVNDKSCLIVVYGENEGVWKSARNIPHVKVMRSCELNAYEVLKYKKILIMKDALENIR